jgi:hypothetical protein
MASLGDFMRHARERDRQFIMSLNLERMEKALLPLYIAYLCLDFLDVYSTLLALRTDLFKELNPIASTLFSLHFNGFLIAVAFKYLPAIPLFYLIFVKDTAGRHPFEIRVLRFAALVTLISAVGLLSYIVAWNNIPTLIGYLSR